MKIMKYWINKSPLLLTGDYVKLAANKLYARRDRQKFYRERTSDSARNS